MSHVHRPSNARRGHHHASKAADKQNPKVTQLKEMFPDWSQDDIASMLVDVNYDVELAATRITEGFAQHWGSVTHKKDKKTGQAPTNVRSSSFSGDSERGGFRGARGGRGGTRGARGGARGGTGRGGHRETNGRSPAPQTPGSWENHEGAAAEPSATSTVDWGVTNGDSSQVAEGQASNASAVNASPEVTQDPAAKFQTNGIHPDKLVEARVAVPAQASVAAKTGVKAPGAPVRSWAQIAKPQEKPKAPPAPAPAPAAAAPPPPVAEPVAPPPEPEQQSEPEPTGWEEPTTIQPPTWDDEPQPQTIPDNWNAPVEVEEIKPESVQEEPSPVPVQQTLHEPEPAQVSAPKAIPASVRQKADPAVTPPNKPSTPVSYARSLNSRAGNRFKTDQAVVLPSAFGASVEKLGMQFGSVGLGDEEPASEQTVPEPSSEAAVQVQEPTREIQTAPTQLPQEPVAPAPIAAPQQPSIASSQSPFQQVLPQTQSQPQSSLQHTPSLLHSQATPSAISSQVATSTNASTPLSSFASQAAPSSLTSVSPYQAHQAQVQVSHTPQAQSHTPAQTQGSQHSQLQPFAHLPSHLEQQASQISHVQPQPQQAQPQSLQQPQQSQSSLQQGLGSHGSYFRQPEQNFHHSQTPPAGQGQDSAYGSFGPSSQQLGYQSQSSHLSNFSDQFAGYNDQARGYYDSYGQQSSFGRNNLSHDDLSKNLQSAQQPSQVSSGLPQTNSQVGQQQQAAAQQAQTTAQPQAPTAGQPQQGYAPMPYYFTPPHYQAAGQFYGSPYGQAAYGGLNQYGGRFQPQQPLYQPSNPTSASPANAKGPSGPQSLPYGQSMYGQQHASSYDDGYGLHSQLGQTHSLAGMPDGYGKQLYGAQGIQSFMQSSSPNAPLGQRGATAAAAAGGAAPSPDTTYKPYGQGVGPAKDLGGAPGVGAGITGAQGALGQSARPGGVQAPAHSQGLYGSGYGGAGRFSGTPNVNGPAAQGAAQQQSQGYPQSAAGDYGFNYQRTQNGQPYWGNA